MKKEAIVLFDPASSGEGLKYTAREMGYQVIAVFSQPWKSFQEIYHATQETLFQDCDEVIVSDDKEEILRKLEALPFSIKAVIAATEGGVELSDEVAHHLKLWHNPMEFSKARRDKGAMRQLLKKSGLSCPDFSLCASEEEVRDFAKNHFFPLIIKTPKGVMTSQVYECDTLESLVASFHQICGKEDIYGNRAKYAVVEEFISGQEYIVDTFSDGKKVHATDVWIYEKIHTISYKNIYYNILSLPLSDPAVKPLIEYGIRVATVFGIERGPAHIEIKDDLRRGPTLIEIGMRLPGVRIPQVLQKHSNYDAYQAMIEVFVQGKVDHFPTTICDKHLAIAFFPQFKEGKVKSFSGLSEIERLSSYDFHLLNLKVGDILLSSTHGGTIPLLVYLANQDRSQLLKDTQAAHALFKVEFSPRK